MIALEEENTRRRQECQENEGKGKRLDKDEEQIKPEGFMRLKIKTRKLVKNLVKNLEVEGCWDGPSLDLAFWFSIKSVQVPGEKAP